MPSLKASVHRVITLTVFALAIAPNVTGCELANQTVGGAAILQPQVTLTESSLVSYPSATQLAAHFCPDFAPALIGEQGCLMTFKMNELPRASDLQFHFELRYLIDNPNNFPILTTEILAKIDVFEGLAQSQLGAVCAKLCEPGTPNCNAAPDPSSCTSQDGDIETIDDLKDAVTDLIILTAEAAINGDLENLFVREIPAAAKEYEVRVRFSLGINSMLSLIRQLAETLVADARAGRDLALKIPYAVGGALWIDAPLLGRVAFNYGPLKSEWVLNK